MPEPLPLLHAHERELREHFHVRSLALFGSVARGQVGPASDVDLLVEFDRPIGLLHLSATALRLEGLLARPVDLVLRRALRPELRARVARRGGRCLLSFQHSRVAYRWKALPILDPNSLEILKSNG